ncbi:helix-turn-helix transcriptional regulator [Pedobacter sp. PWIIR3]
MKISVTDRQGTGIMAEFARAIGASVEGRYFRIPKSKGGGYITGFTWGTDLRMLVRNYYLNEEILVDRTNELAEGQDYIVFLLSGIFSSPLSGNSDLMHEQASVMICRHAASSLITMPSNTSFRSITIAVSRQYLQQVFGTMLHPVVQSILRSTEQFVYEAVISAEMVRTANEMLTQPIPESIERHFYKLKCEELLCYIFSLLAQRDETPTSGMHIADIKAIYAIKSRLQSDLHIPPDIASLAREAGMSEPKMRKLFKQTFGKGVFNYYQSMRMNEAARLLKNKRLSVSEVGYNLGFTNLSHFSRVFEKYIGLKPKKYSAIKIEG